MAVYVLQDQPRRTKAPSTLGKREIVSHNTLDIMARFRLFSTCNRHPLYQRSVHNSADLAAPAYGKTVHLTLGSTTTRPTHVVRKQGGVNISKHHLPNAKESCWVSCSAPLGLPRMCLKILLDGASQVPGPLQLVFGAHPCAVVNGDPVGGLTLMATAMALLCLCLVVLKAIRFLS